VVIVEIGVSTFVETTPDVETGEVISYAQRIREVVEEIVLADQVGLDVFGVGATAAINEMSRASTVKWGSSFCCFFTYNYWFLPVIHN
jgi:hypothetical protein